MIDEYFKGCSAAARRRGRLDGSALWALAGCIVVMGTVCAVANDVVVVPVPRAAIYPGAPIGDDQLEDRKYRSSVTRAGVHLTRESVVGKVARRALLPGRPIPMIALKEAEPVSAGQTVTMVFSSGGLEITGRGMALQSGKVGEIISVRNVDSGIVIRAAVDREGTVIVGEK